MKIRHCLIVEDSAPFVLLIKSYLKRIPFFNMISSCGSVAEAFEILGTDKIDLMILDVELSDVSGMTLLRGLSATSIPPTILISSHGEYAVESYAIGIAVDFIKKPFDFDRFLLALNRALNIHVLKNSYSNQNSILLKKGRVLQKFNYDEINFIEAYGIYTKICTNKGIDVVNENISSLERKLDQHKFARVHKSYIINTEKITNVDNKSFWINEQHIPIGRFYKPQFDAIFQLFDKTPDQSSNS